MSKESNSILILNIKHFIALIFVLTLGIESYGQIKNKEVNGLVFEHFENELSIHQRYISTLIQDSNGFVWMGTHNGVNVYDGKNFTFYKDYFNENKGFKGQRVKSILEDSKGRILIGTRSSGINVFIPESGEFINYNDELFRNAKSTFISTITESSNGEITISGDKSIIKIVLNDKGEIVKQSVFNPELEEGEHIKQALYFEDNYLIVTNKNIFLNEDPEPIFKFKNIQFCKVRYNQVWILANKQLFNLDIEKGVFETIDYAFPEAEGNTYDFEFILPNMLFVATSKGALQLKLDDKNNVTSTDVLRIREVSVNDKKVIVGVRSIFKDKVGNLYFMLRGNRGGLMKLNKNQLNYKYIGLPEQHKFFFISNIFHDSEGIYWLSTPRGLIAFDSNKNDFKKFNDDSIVAFYGNDFTSIVEDRKGQVWINSSFGILNYNRANNDFTTYKIPSDVSPKYYPNSFLDKSDNLWFPTKNGVAMMNTVSHKITDYNIGEPTAIFLDKYNTLWVNLHNDGLYSYKITEGKLDVIDSYKESFSTLNPRIFYSPVRDIKSDNLDRLWLTGYNGIYVYDYKNREIVKHINQNNLLIDDGLFEILKDANGNFWVKQLNTEAFCVDANTFEIIERLPSWINTIPDLRGHSGPIHQDKNGLIFMNGLDGFFVYNPEDLKLDPTPPRVVITDVIINGKTEYSNFVGTKDLNLKSLSYNRNSIQLNIKEVGQNNSPHKELAYRFKGVTDQWQFTKDLQALNYNELQPNTYELEVKSTNNGKIWSEPIVLTSFTITPPWWKSIYAFIAYVLFILIIIYSFYKIQLNRKLAEAEAEKLKEVDDFKNKFFQNITHEFRTPLTVINGAIDNIQKDTATLIKRNTDQLLRLVNELLEVGKIESNISKLDITTQDIVSFTKYCLESLESIASKKSIAIEFHSNKDYQLLDFDISKMQLVMNNLISNAIKYTPNYGKVQVTIETTLDLVEIHVKDTGPGIPVNDLEKIFDRYYRSEANASETGTGIGLALTREIVKIMDGSISAKNNEDIGACLTVKLPLVSSNLNELTNITPKVIDTNQISDENIILVIEDNTDVLNYIISLLEKTYTVHTAPNGKIGHEKAVEIIPDLIISDVMMPVMDGYEACSLIKSDFRTSHIPIIMLTAKVDIDSKISGLKLGADAYLGKPFDKNELFTHIDNLIAIREGLKKKYSQAISNDTDIESETTDPFIDKLTSLLTNNLSDSSFGIDQICKEIGVSRAQLHRKLKALTGLSASIFIREIRLSEGYKLISSTNLTVSEVAYSVGFNDPHYFSKLFAEKFNILPSKVKQ